MSFAPMLVSRMMDFWSTWVSVVACLRPLPGHSTRPVASAKPANTARLRNAMRVYERLPRSSGVRGLPAITGALHQRVHRRHGHFFVTGRRFKKRIGLRRRREVFIIHGPAAV